LVSETKPETGSRGGLARVVATALVMLLFCVGSGRAGNNVCSSLSVASASDLLAISGANPFGEFLPPSVRCTSEGLNPEPAICESRRTITHDQMIGGERRLLVVRVTPSKGASSDYVFAFGCVDGRIQSVLHDRFHPSAKIESASLDEIMVKGSDQPGNSPDRMTFYWNAELQAYLFEPSDLGPPALGPGIKCGDLASANATELIAIPRDGFPHGVGCYSEDQIPSSSRSQSPSHSVIPTAVEGPRLFFSA
jgi:hypothetical protein